MLCVCAETLANIYYNYVVKSIMLLETTPTEETGATPTQTKDSDKRISLMEDNSPQAVETVMTMGNCKHRPLHHKNN